MAANANCAVAIEIHSHHNEFKMHLLVECRVKFKSPFQKKKNKSLKLRTTFGGTTYTGTYMKDSFSICLYFSFAQAALNRFYNILLPTKKIFQNAQFDFNQQYTIRLYSVCVFFLSFTAFAANGII